MSVGDEILVHRTGSSDPAFATRDNRDCTYQGCLVAGHISERCVLQSAKLDSYNQNPLPSPVAAGIEPFR